MSKIKKNNTTEEKIMNRFKEMSVLYGVSHFDGHLLHPCCCNAVSEDYLAASIATTENALLILDYLKRKLRELQQNGKVVSATFTLSLFITISHIFGIENPIDNIDLSINAIVPCSINLTDKPSYVVSKKSNIQEIDLASNLYEEDRLTFALTNTYNSYLREYASYYHFDADKVIHLAREMTNNYTIPFNDVVNVDFEVEQNPELEAMLFVNQLNRDSLITPLTDMELSKDDFKLEEDIVTINEDLVLDNGMTFSQYLGKVADLMNLDKDYALAISLYESGRVTSDIALNKNNFGGLSNGTYLTFATPEAGIIAYCCNLKKFENYNVQNIEQLSGLYTHGNRNNPSDLWVYSVNSFHYDIVNNQSDYFIIEEEIENPKLALKNN